MAGAHLASHPLVERVVRIELGVGWADALGHELVEVFFFWFEQFSMEQVLAWIILFVVLMLALEHGVFARLESRAFAWRPSHSQ